MKGPPSGKDLFMLFASLASVCGGSCALAWLLRCFKYKKLAAVAAIPLGLVLIVTGMLAEGGLFAVPELESFEYLFQEGQEIPENAFYDDTKKVMNFNGQEYPPEIVPNPDRAEGIAAVGEAAYEALNPFGGSGIAIISLIENESVPGWVLPLYLCKAAGWIALPAALPAKKKRTEPEEP